jgi:hypothetical protein
MMQAIPQNIAHCSEVMMQAINFHSKMHWFTQFPDSAIFPIEVFRIWHPEGTHKFVRI